MTSSGESPMKAEGPTYKLITLRIFLLISFIGGIWTTVTLFQIAPDPKNTGLLGYSLSRWVLICGVIGLSLVFGYLLAICLRGQPQDTKILFIVDTIIEQPRYWLLSIAIFLSSSIAIITIFFLSLITEFSVFALRLVPLLIWMLVITLHAVVAIIFLVMKNLHPNFHLRKNKKVIYISTTLFLLSLGIRLLFAIPVINAETPPAFDEFGYYNMVTGFEEIISNIADGQYPSEETKDLAYYEGRWPPLYPILLAVSAHFLGANLATARLTVLLFSALTTPLVFILTRKLFTEKAGIVSAFIHLIYPSFIAYSHFLWSESIYIFFLLITTYFIKLLSDTDNNDRILIYSVLGGMFLGLSGLIRTTSLPFLIILPIWIFYVLKGHKYRIASPTMIFSFCILLWIPWLIFLNQKEGEFMPMATTGGYNLYVGNNPFGEGIERIVVIRSLDEYSKTNKVTRDTAARNLAFEDIQGNLPKFLKKSAERVILFWNSDSFIMRHIFNLVYPPIPANTTIGIWVIVISSYIAFLLLILWGMIISFTDRKFVKLILLLVISGMILPAISITNTRLHLPLLTLMLPIAGFGATSINVTRSTKQLKIFLIATTSIISLTVLLFPIHLNFVRPSSFYSTPIQKINSIFNIDLSFKDRIYFENSHMDIDTIHIIIISDGYFFENSNDKEIIWNLPYKDNIIPVVIESKNPSNPLQIKIYSEALDKSTIIQPINQDALRIWLQLGFGQIRYSWRGGD